MLNSHLKLDIRIIRMTNFIDEGSDEKLFIRYYIYIPIFGNKRIQIDTKEIHRSSSVLLNECASFECDVNSDQLKQLELSDRITFELRSRRTRRSFGGIMTRSRLLGGGEISWKDVMDSKGMELEEWVKFIAKSEKFDGFKLPNLLVKLKVEVKEDVNSNGKRRHGSNKDCDWVGSEVDIYHVETLVD